MLDLSIKVETAWLWLSRDIAEELNQSEGLHKFGIKFVLYKQKNPFKKFGLTPCLFAFAAVFDKMYWLISPTEKSLSVKVELSIFQKSGVIRWTWIRWTWIRWTWIRWTWRLKSSFTLEKQERIQTTLLSGKPLMVNL